MNKLTTYMIIASVVFLSGFGLGWHIKTIRTNASIVKQVVKVTKIEGRNQIQVERQNESDKVKINQLQADLDVARRDAAARGVPKPPNCRRLPTTQGDARAREAASADDESAARYESAYRAFRDELFTSAAVAEQLRLQVLSCQAQWPR